MGEPVEAAVRTETYFDVMTRVTRTTKTAKRAASGASTRACTCSTCPRAPTSTDARADGTDGATAQPALRERRGARLMPPTLNPLDLVSRINRDVERSLLARATACATCAARTRRTRGDAQGGRVGRGKAELWRYRNGEVRYGPPVLIVHSLVSRSYILDLRPGQQPGRVPHGRRPRRLHARLGRAGRARRRQRPRAYVDDYMPRAVEAVLRESGADEVTLAGYCLGGLLTALYAAGHEDARRAQPDPDGDAGRLRRDGRDGRLPARGPPERRRARRRHRQRPRRRALQRLLHAGADDRDRPEGDAARQPLERRVRRGLPGDGAVVARPRAVPRRDVPRARRGTRAQERPDDRLDPGRRPQGRPRRRAGQRA